MVCFAADSHRCAREAPGTVVATDTASVDAGFANGAALRGASWSRQRNDAAAHRVDARKRTLLLAPYARHPARRIFIQPYEMWWSCPAAGLGYRVFSWSPSRGSAGSC